MMKKLTLLVLCASTAFASETPVAKDARIKMVTYQQNQIVPVHGVTFTTTQIIFGEHETVLDVENGDSAVWMATYHKNLPTMLFLKPTLLNSNSNMTVVTNRHNYYCHGTSNKTLEEATHQQTYALKFVYPDDDRQRVSAKLKAQQMCIPRVAGVPLEPSEYNGFAIVSAKVEEAMRLGTNCDLLVKLALGLSNTSLLIN